MIGINGLNGLIGIRSELNNAGWIFVSNKEGMKTVSSIVSARYFLAEDGDEEIDMEESHFTFLECGIFTSVIDLEEKAGRQSVSDVAAGCLYYLEKDTFRG